MDGTCSPNELRNTLVKVTIELSRLKKSNGELLGIVKALLRTAKDADSRYTMETGLSRIIIKAEAIISNAEKGS